MKKVFFGSLLLLGAALVSGCLVSEQRLPANEAPSAQSPLLGLWQSPWPATLTRESLNVSYVEGQDHYVAVRGRAKYFGQDDQGRPVEVQETVGYKAYPYKAGNRTFFSLLSMKSQEPVYAIVETILENGGKKLLIHEPSDAAVERSMADGTLAWRMKEDSKLVTSAPEAIAAWLVALSDDDFTLHETFERWPAPVDDLKERLNNNP